MVGSAQFYRHNTVSSGRKKLWDPYETLGIINTDPGYECITCVGNAPTQGRRCRNEIKNDNQNFIEAVLSEISFLPPDSPVILSRLQEIVGPALCVRRHQSQAGSIMLQWKRNIQQLKRQSEYRKERTRTPPRNPKQDSEKLQKQSKREILGRIRELEELLARFEQESDDDGGQSSRHVRREERGTQRRRTGEQTRQMNEEMQREARREERGRLETERLEEERLEREKLKREKRERERREEERLEKERLEKERLEKERLNRESLERERREEERLEKERLKRERIEREKKESDETNRRKQEQAAHNERIRQRAAKRREDEEREKREAELRDKEEWEQAWSKYQSLWASFKVSSSNVTTGEGEIREVIPWPVKSGSHRDVNASNVRDFLQRAVAKEENNSSSLLRKECRKWHPDMMDRLLRGVKLMEVDRMMIEMICRVVTELLNKSAGRDSEFLD